MQINVHFAGQQTMPSNEPPTKHQKQSPNYSSGIRTDTCRRMRQQDFLLASIIRNQKHLVFIRMATSSLYTKTRQTANVPSAIRVRMKLMLSMNFI